MATFPANRPAREEVEGGAMAPILYCCWTCLMNVKNEMVLLAFNTGAQGR